MRHVRIGWLVVGVLVIAPYAVAMAAGAVWFYERSLLWYWIVLCGVTTLVTAVVARWLQRRRVSPLLLGVEPNPVWPADGRAAWQSVASLAEEAKAAPPPLDRVDLALAELGKLVQAVFGTVAAHFHPRSSQPLLEVTLPHVLHIVELAARDLRHEISTRVPLSHVLTLHDLERLPRLTALARRGYTLYRLVRLAVNPAAAVPRELIDQVYTRYRDLSIDELSRWAIGYYVQKLGYYAIQLYSGQLVLSEEEFQRFSTRETARDTSQAQRRTEERASEPLRLLVVGQVKAGKSSLINALFGETVAAVDVVPRTRFIEPFALELEGARRALILDTAGYEVPGGGEVFAPLRDAVLRADLVLLVVSATSAARAADRRVLDELRRLFHEAADRSMPPVLVALTHIDLLRPLAEWDPPYRFDEDQDKNPKARSIRQAAMAVAADLAVPPEDVVPVCLRADATYNVEEALWPAIWYVLPEAERAKALRCLPEYRRRRNWELLWQQAANSGQLLWQLGGAGLASAVGKWATEPASPSGPPAERPRDPDR